MKLVLIFIVFIIAAGIMWYLYSVSETKEIPLTNSAPSTNFADEKDSLRNTNREKISSGQKLFTTVTCPHCGHKKREEMPTESCLIFYECKNCKTVLRPQHGDCCVFCTYGEEKCPSMQ